MTPKEREHKHDFYGTDKCIVCVKCGHSPTMEQRIKEVRVETANIINVDILGKRVKYLEGIIPSSHLLPDTHGKIKHEIAVMKLIQNEIKARFLNGNY